jgi:putative CRISPR-associated protein (TIGR02619 family)
MMNKFIVTCGTSQLDRMTIDNLGEGVLAKFGIRGLDDLLDNPDSSEVPKTFYEWVEEVVIPASEKIWADDLKKLTDLIGTRNNPLGAELSTMHKLMVRDDGVKWAPTEDELIVISSDTARGKSAAALVKALFAAIYHVPAGKIEIVVVQGLNENPRKGEIDRALDNFANVLLDSMNLSCNSELQLGHNKDSEHYAIVMSGGFKSVIPCLTLASYFFGIELVYLFETSAELQTLQPNIDLSSDKKIKFWQGVWEELSNQGFANQPSYVRTLLGCRKKYPKRTF